MKKFTFEDASQFFFTEQSHHEIITAFQPIMITLPFLRSDKADGLPREVRTKQTRALHVQLQLTAHCAAGHFACGRGNSWGFSFLFCSVMQGLNVTGDSFSMTKKLNGFYENA